MKRTLALSPNNIYFFGLLVLVAGLPFSNFLMSLSQMFLGVAWILSGNYVQRMKQFWHNKPAVVLVSVFLMHIIGLLYTTDFEYGLEDVRKKIPLLMFPFIITTMEPLTRTKFKWLLLAFVCSVLVWTIYGLIKFFGWFDMNISDTRQMATNISHIRFGLMICVSIFILSYYLYCSNAKWEQIIFATIIIWLFYFLCLMEAMTGVMILFITTLFLLFYMMFKANKKLYKIISATLFFSAMAGLYFFISPIVKEFISVPPLNYSNLKLQTKNGNDYYHDTNNLQIENGNYVGLYICWDELKPGWNKRSTIHFDSLDLAGNKIEHTIIRFMTSKNLRKDSEGLTQLTNENISAIEKGIPNVNYKNTGILSFRTRQVIWELYEYFYRGDPRSHSVTQRFEFWKAAVGIIKENPLLGVGTGDAKTAYHRQYAQMNSPLEEKSRLRAHNQYLAIGVAFGIVGIIWFLFSLLYPALKTKNFYDFLYVTFFITAIISMMSEDTLETQAGVTFYAFFNSLFLFGRQDA